MKRWLRSLPCLLTMGALGDAAQAHADFKLTKPTAWIAEDAQGGPQKAGPCGPASDGDAMLSGAITEVKVGDTVEVEFTETVSHTGWFRISLAANRSELKPISFSGTDCSYDLDTVPAVPHGNVLADGVGKTETTGPNRAFKEQITIPNTPCEKCTLQVIQVMTDGATDCVAYHCAELKIVAAERGMSGGAGAGGAAQSQRPTATGGATHTSVPMSTGGMGGDATSAASAGAPSTDPLVSAATSKSGSAGKESKSNGVMMMTAGSGGAGGKGAASSGKATGVKPGKSTSPEASGESSEAEEEEEETSESADAGPTRGAKAKAGGCVVSQPGSRTSLVSAALFSLASVLLGARRRRGS